MVAVAVVPTGVPAVAPVGVPVGGAGGDYWNLAHRQMLDPFGTQRLGPLAASMPSVTASQGLSPGLSPGFSSNLSPGLSSSLAPGLSSSLTPGLSSSLAPGLSSSLTPSLSPGLSPGVLPASVPPASSSLTSTLPAGVRPAASTSPMRTLPASVSPATTKVSGAARNNPAARARSTMRKAPELGLITQLLPPVANLLTPEGFGTNPHGECSGNGVGMDSALNAGVANGIQAYVPVQAPINFTGNAIGIGGSAAATSDNTFASAKMC